MTSSDSDETLVARLLDLPAAERALALERACAEDPELRGRLPEIEAELASAGEFEDAPPNGGLSPDSLVQAFNWALEATPSEIPGARIGPYKLLQEIGRGGFGMVWMAEQEGPIKRRVALKIIKAGMDTKEVIARFDAERQALALMDHPNIARVFDAGATGGGRPYFVMELVRGVAITEYCDENRLTVEARLRLFILVCQAVQHAHQKGVIHRDLKPSNILVTLHDGVPVPKVIDFGIAKATMSQLTDMTLFTRFNAFIGTPAYTSPEQMEMSGLDIDTRSDIYSLGVLLYEMLVGRPPFDAGALARSGLETMRRTIREIDPPKPSHSLTSLTNEECTFVAQRRRTEAGKLSLLLRGDLDWIVMRCLEKDRTRRYESATGVARDIQRHLESEPVSARPPTSAYRVRKFIRRHKLVFAAATAIAASLVAGLIASSMLLVRERAAHARAEENFRRAQAAETMAHHSQTEAQRNRQQADSARREAEQLLTYLLGEFQGKLFDTGQLELFEQLARRTVDYYKGLPADLVTDSTELNHAVALALLGSVLNRENRSDEAEKPIADSIAVFRQRIGTGDRSLDAAKGSSLAWSTRAALYDSRADEVEAERSMKEAVAALRPFMADPAEREALQPIFARRLMLLGFMQRESVGGAAAERTFLEAAGLMEAAGGTDSRNEDVAADYSTVLAGLAFQAVGRNERPRARQWAEQAIALQTAILKQSPSRLQMLQQRAGAYGVLGLVLYDDDKLRGAVASCEQADRDYEFYLHLNPADGKIRQFAALNKNCLASGFRELGRIADARKLLEAGLADSTERNISSELAVITADGYWDLALVDADTGDRKGAEDALVESRHYHELFGRGAPAGGFLALVATESPRTARLSVEIDLGAPPAAVQEEARAILADLKAPRTESWGARANYFHRIMLERIYDVIAEAALELGQFRDAEEAAEAAVNLERSALGNVPMDTGYPRLAGSERLLAEAVARQGRLAEARATIDPLVAAAREKVEAEPESVSGREDLANMLMTQALAQESASHASRRSLLDETQALLAGMPTEVAGTGTFRRMHARLVAEQASIDPSP